MNSFLKFFDVRQSPVVKLFGWMFKSRILRIALLLFVAVFLFLGLWAFWYEPDSLTVKNYQLKIAGWNAAHNNFKIVAISDLHGGGRFITEAKIRRVVELANAQEADLIVFLGDYVSQTWLDKSKLNMPPEMIADNLRGLKARHGVYGVMGNHDAWFSDAHIRRELERAGIRILENEAVRIEANGQPLRVIGLPDVLKAHDWIKYSVDARAALEKIPNEGKVIALTHSPDTFPLTAATEMLSISPDYVMMLCGHTHGGQVRLPFVGTPVVPTNYGQKYVRGEIIEYGIHLFITPGIGTSIYPVRFGVPPEISVLTVSSE
jgi:hypothetical protein